MYYLFLDEMQVPIPPASIDTSISSRNETIDLLTAGEVNIIRSPALTEISFDFLLPNSDYPFNGSMLMRFQKASYYIDRLEQFKVTKQPFQFIVVRMKPSGGMLAMTNIKVTLEEYIIRDDAEEGFDMVAKIKLRRYKDWGAKKIEVKTDKDGNTTGSVTSQRSTTGHFIPERQKAGIGTTLQQAVKKTFGSTNNLFMIAKLNKIAVPGVLAAGQIIKMKGR